jgi:hypothetical protein
MPLKQPRTAEFSFRCAGRFWESYIPNNPVWLKLDFMIFIHLRCTIPLVVPLGPANAVDSVHSGVFVAVVIEEDMGAAESFPQPISLIPTFMTTRNDLTASFSSR